MDEKEYVLLLQGSFDPVTLAHVSMFTMAYSYLINNGYSITEKFIIPTSDKYEWKTLQSNEHRLNMLMLALYGTDILISDVEMEHNRWLRTNEVMKRLKESYPHKELLYLCGGDKVLELKKWKDPKETMEELQKYCTIVCIGRETYNFTDDFLNEMGLVKFVKIPLTIENTSSTFVRNNIREDDIIKKHLNKDVLHYIRICNLYE